MADALHDPTPSRTWRDFLARFGGLLLLLLVLLAVLIFAVYLP